MHGSAMCCRGCMEWNRSLRMNRREFVKGGIAVVSVAALAGCGKDEGVTGKEDDMVEKTFNELIETRRSVRRYAASEISREELAVIVGEALNAPSWKNNEETRYRVALSADAKNALLKEALPSFNAANSANAAALVVVTFKKGLSGFGNGQPVNELGDMWGAYDAGLASSYFVLAAKNHGWDTLIMGIRDAEAIRQIMSVPGDEIVTAVIALGKSAQPYFKNPRKGVDEVLVIA